MSHRSDTLPAISALAEHYASKIADRYIAGLFQSILLPSLLWKRDILATPFASRPEGYRAPSWSWASVSGKVVWEGARSPTSKFLELVHCTAYPCSDDFPFGAVRSATLVLKKIVLNDCKRVSHIRNL